MQSLGLVLAGFLVGIIVTNLDYGSQSGSAVTSSQGRQGSVQGTADYSDYQRVAQTDVWDVLVESEGDGRSIALGQNGLVRVVVRDDKSALYVMTYKADDPVWQGRLMDVGNDGTVEVADLSFGRCEAFK